ncbi:MAG: HAMP domain-containing protein [Deltaproteobacteria bacterium]|nr:HAMP domain-containing protein [Deltaproteobacteria bacterium]
MARRGQRESWVTRSLAGKLTVGFLLIAALEAVLLGAVSLYSLRRSTAINRQLEEISLSLEATRSLGLDFAQVSQPLDEYLLGGGDTPTLDKFRGALSVVRTSLKSCGSAVCHGAAKEPEEMAAVLSPLIADVEEKGMAIFESRKKGEDPTRIRGEIDSVVLQAQSLMDTMSSALSGRVKVLRRESAQIGQGAILLFFLFTSLSLGLTAAVAFAVARRITVPVRQLLVGTRSIRGGDLDHRVSVQVQDEIGDLAESFNAMVGTLKEYKDRIDDYSRSLEEKVRVRTEELKKAQDSLLQSEKLASIGLLASGVAHELNNPLTGILMNVNLLLEDAGANPELSRELKRIAEDALRCKRIIDDLRDFSRRHELDIRPSDINEVVRKTLGLIRHELDLKKIQSRQEFSPEVPWIACDPDRMGQVLMNVFVNAIQAMPQGGSLTVRTGFRNAVAEIMIQDSGPGIPKEIRSRIFDPFFTTKQGGTGLGLSIVYRIMEEHGGRVAVESRTAEEAEPGSSGSVGTTVRLFIPLQALSNQASAVGRKKTES